MKMNFKVASLMMAVLAGAAARAGTEFRELARFPVAGDGGWDYLKVDSSARRLYLAHTTRISVIDADSGKVIGEVKGLDGAHGVEWASDLGLGFATSGKSGEVFVFDLKTFQVSARIKVGKNPDAILYETGSKRLLAFNAKDATASVIDPVSGKVTGTIALPGKPEAAAGNGRGKVFVDIEDKNELLELDPLTFKILGAHPLAPCEEPTALALDTATKRLIVGCGNRLAAIVDAESGKVRQTFKVGNGVDAAAFDAARKLAFISAGEGSLTVLSENDTGFQKFQDVATVKSARTLAVDEKTGHVFLPVGELIAPPAGSPEHTHPTVKPGTLALLVVGRE